jgi:hypothetical protein
MVRATYPPPTEAIFAGVPTMKERLARLARALFAWYDAVALDVIRADRDRVEVLRKYVEEEEAHRIEVARAALAPFAIDRDLILASAALLDVGVCRSLQRVGLSRDQAADTIVDIIHARLTRKD